MPQATHIAHLLRIFFVAALLVAFNAALAYAADAEPSAASIEAVQGDIEPSAPEPNVQAPASEDADSSEAQDETPIEASTTTDTTPSAEPETPSDPEPEYDAVADEQAPASVDEAVEPDPGATGDTAAQSDAAAEEPAAAESSLPAAEEPATEGIQTAAATTKATASGAASSGTSKSAAKKAAKRTISAKKYKKLLKLLYKGLKKHSSTIGLLSLKLRKSDARTLDQALWEVLYERHPEIFYARGDYYYWWNGSGKIYKFKPHYLYGKKKTKKLKSKYEKSMKKLLSWVPKNGTKAQKAKAVHDWLVRNCSYNHTAVNNKTKWTRSNTKFYPWTALGAMVNKKPVCQGYTLAFQDAMNRLKIKSLAVEGGNHSWNRTKIGTKWYTVDVTNDDDGGSGAIPSTTIFLKSDGYLRQNYSHWVNYASWSMLGGYAPSGAKKSGTTYDKTDTLSWKIYGPKINLTSSDCDISDAYEYNGRIIQAPDVSITMENDYRYFTLVEGRDYTVTFDYNINAPVSYAIIKGIGNFTGTKKLLFSIY